MLSVSDLFLTNASPLIQLEGTLRIRLSFVIIFNQISNSLPSLLCQSYLRYAVTASIKPLSHSS